MDGGCMGPPGREPPTQNFATWFRLIAKGFAFAPQAVPFRARLLLIASTARCHGPFSCSLCFLPCAGPAALWTMGWLGRRHWDTIRGAGAAGGRCWAELRRQGRRHPARTANHPPLPCVACRNCFGPNSERRQCLLAWACPARPAPPCPPALCRGLVERRCRARRPPACCSR